MDISIQIIGWIATIFSVVTFMPQSLKTIRTRNLEGLSSVTYSIYMMGVTLWSFYALLPTNSMWPGFASNLIVGLLLVPIVWLVFKNKFKAMIIISIFIVVEVMGIVFNLKDIDVHSALYLVFAIIAGCFTGLGFMPQIISVIRNRGAEGFSNISAYVNIVASILWGLYFIFVFSQDFENGTVVLVIAGALFTIFANVLLGISNATIILMIKHYSKRRIND